MTVLSIIIPHYNSTESLITLLKTIPNRREVQILVVDDHSSKEEKKKLLKVEKASEHKNIEFLINHSNRKGAGACRNIGLSHASGEWILFADSDDFFVDGFFDIVKKYFKSNYDVIFFKPTSIEADTGSLSDRHTPFVALIDDYSSSKSRVSETLLRYRFVVPWSKLIRKSTIIKHGILFEEVISANDVMFSTKLGYYMEIFDVSDETVYCVTKNQGSLTMTITKDVFDTRISVFIRYYNFLRESLKEKDFLSLELSGRGYLLDSISSFGLKKFLSVFITLKRSKVRVLDKKIFNPVYLFRKTLFYFQKNKDQKRYRKVK